MKLGTSNCVNYSTRNPKRSAKNVYHTWKLASSTARAGTSCEKEERRTRNLFNTQWISIPFQTTLKKGRPRGHRYGKKPSDKEHDIHNQLKKKCKKFFQGIHDRVVRDEQFRSRILTLVEPKIATVAVSSLVFPDLYPFLHPCQS